MDSAHNKEEMIADDQPSYNSIDRFPHVCDQIFGFLDHESLLNALLVCTSWNKFIGQSSELMKKTKVDFRYYFGIPIEDRLIIIEGWNRKIFHFKVGHLFNEENRSIESIIGNASILQHLISLDISAPTLHSIKHILVTSLLLKHLNIHCEESNHLDWLELAVEFENIKLKSLTIDMENKSLGIERFLGTQTQLEELGMRRTFLNSASMKIITQMKRLKDLKLIDVKYEPNIVGNMPSLESLKVSDRYTFNTIINSAPNLIKLDIKSLDQAFINSAGSKLKKLKILHAESFDFENISNPDLFPALEEFKIKDRFRFYFRNRIRRALAGESTNFKRCLYAELNLYLDQMDYE